MTCQEQLLLRDVLDLVTTPLLVLHQFLLSLSARLLGPVRYPWRLRLLFDLLIVWLQGLLQRLARSWMQLLVLSVVQILLLHFANICRDRDALFHGLADAPPLDFSLLHQILGIADILII